MKRYVGTREGHATEVRVDGHRLNPRLDLWNHSPTGLEWGYDGSGPAQLALALLADHLGNDDAAVSLHQDFKSQVVASLPYHGWTLTSEEIHNILAGLKAPASAATMEDFGL